MGPFLLPRIYEQETHSAKQLQQGLPPVGWKEALGSCPGWEGKAVGRGADGPQTLLLGASASLSPTSKSDYLFSAWHVVGNEIGTLHAASHQTPITALHGGNIISIYQMRLKEAQLENCPWSLRWKGEVQDHLTQARGAHSGLRRRDQALDCPGKEETFQYIKKGNHSVKY